jgi:ABC-type transport system involved in multi-copper enzyme maturation permease subunit
MTPSALATARLMAAMSIRRARRGKLLWLTALVMALPVAAALLALVSGNAGEAFYEKVLEVYLRYLSPFVLSLYASFSVAEEVQAKTITYLFCRPVARWALPLGKYLAAVTVCAVLMCGSLLLVFIVSMLGEPSALMPGIGTLLSGLLAVLLAAIHFGAVAAAFGAMITSYPFVLTLIYFMAVEVGFSFVPGWFKVVAMSVHLRVIAGLYKPASSMFVSDPDLSVKISLPVVLAMTLVWLLVAIGWVSTTEYRTDK